jgi:UbiD family decarboxylase
LRHPNLQSFLATLRREGELHVIDEPVNPILELAEIQRRTVARQGPALLFTRVTGSRFPVLTNMFGTRRRIDLAFGEEPLRFFRRIAQAAEMMVPPKVSQLWDFRDLLKAGLKLGLRSVRRGPAVARCIEPANLKCLPQIQAWPEDGGAFLTLPLVYTEDPATHKPNLGMYRNQIYDERTAGMHFQIHRGIGFHYHEAEKAGVPLPANVFLGGPPALILAAIAPLPENISELILAALLQQGRVAQIRDPQLSSLPILAESDFTLVGTIPPALRRLEGPFGDHYGYYSLAHEFPVFDVHKIYHRKDAVFPATVVGRPRQEDHYIGEYLQELFSPLYPLVMNGVRQVWAYDDAGVHTLAAAVVKERYRREAFMAALRILGEGQLSLTKFLMVTDQPLRLQDFRPLLIHILERADFAKDLFIFPNVSQDTLDYTTKTLNVGSKAVLLGLGSKRFDLAAAPISDMVNPRFRRFQVFAPGVLVVEGPPWRENDDAVQELKLEPGLRPFRVICLVDDAADCVRDDASFMWTIFTRLEPAADIHPSGTQLRTNHIELSGPLIFDCRMKPWYPPPVQVLPQTAAAVDAIWPRIFSGEARGKWKNMEL